MEFGSITVTSTATGAVSQAQAEQIFENIYNKSSLHFKLLAQVGKYLR